MEYRNLMDMHIHSDNSKDAHHSVTLICEKAVEKGLRAVAVTDHCECNKYEELNQAVTCRQSAFETHKARQVFEGQLAVVSGIELGSPARNAKAVKDVMKNKFDFVLASIHIIKGKKKSFAHLDYSRDGNRPELLMKRYFDEVAETVEWNGFDSLSHLTYPLRYYPPERIADFNLFMFRTEIHDILKMLAQNGKALEINTAGGDYVTADTAGSMHPGFEIVKMFKDVGGEYITVGSDAHDAFSVGNGIEEAMGMAESAGFKYVTMYRNRIAVPVEIK